MRSGDTIRLTPIILYPKHANREIKEKGLIRIFSCKETCSLILFGIYLDLSDTYPKHINNIHHEP